MDTLTEGDASGKRQIPTLALPHHRSRSSLSTSTSPASSPRSSRFSSTNTLPVWDPSVAKSGGTGASTPDRRYSAISRHHMAMMARNTRLQYVLIVIVSLLLLVTYSPSMPARAVQSVSSSLASRTGFAGKQKQLGELVWRPQDWNERFTLIAAYGGSTEATYLPLFLQTAAQNQRSLDLLLVNIDDGTGCLDLSYMTNPSSITYSSNIKHLCLHESENDEYYTRFICNGWEKGCDRNAKDQVMTHLEGLRNHTRAIHDEIYNTFKPWRGLVYKDHITTKWWAWSDADQVLGSFEHLLPKDVMNNFDMVLPAHSSAVPRSLFLPGQLTLFKNNEKMARMPFRYKPLSSLENIHLLQPGSHTPGLDEGEYTDLYINKLTEVDILRVPETQGAEPLHGDRRLVMVDGHILNAHRHITRDDIQEWFNRIHDNDVRGYRVGKTITEYGKTMPLPVSHEKNLWCNEDFWNPVNTCPTWTPSHASRNLVYRKNGSGWKVRREPRLLQSSAWQFAALEPKMFVHFLLTKVDSDDFKLPDVIQTGYRKERHDARFAAGDGLRKKGRKVAVTEMSWDWWGTWEMTVGDLNPPRGFDKWHKLKRNFTAGEKDYYWRYHHWNADIESPPGAPAPDHRDPWNKEAEVV